MKIVFIDDDDAIRIGITDELMDGGHEVVDFADPREAVKWLKNNSADAVLTDMRMPHMNGREVVAWIRENRSEVPVVVLTAFAEVDLAVCCMKEGAADFLIKPCDPQDLIKTLNCLQGKSSHHLSVNGLIGQSTGMQKVFSLIAKIGKTPSTVLITGETGTGKERIAEAIHNHSPRKNGALVKVSLAVFAEHLLESELFGHIQGAFTGAVRDKRGCIERAAGGTLFLDEVDDIPLSVQVKLLRFLQEGTYERVGDEKTRRADVRVIAATKADLESKTNDGSFRQDLFYRLNVLPVNIPPLRDRGEDILALFDYFAQKFLIDKPLQLSIPAKSELLRYPWPGNVRQLENLVERLSCTLEDEVVQLHHLPSQFRGASSMTVIDIADSDQFADVRADLERRLMAEALEKSGGNKKLAASHLGMPYSTFRLKFDKLGLRKQKNLG